MENNNNDINQNQTNKNNMNPCQDNNGLNNVNFNKNK